MAIPDEPIHTEPAALSAARNRFEDLGQQFLNSVQPIGARRGQVVAGAGEVAGQVEAGAAAFMLSWQAAFGVAADSAGLIAGNIGKTAVDLQAIDRDLTVTVEL